jgi:nitrite reductase/ring-hydroxylating ferredoxin subunit
MDWIKAFPEQELKEGGRRFAQAAARRLLVIRFKDKLYAIESNCPHMRYPLKDGRLSDDGGIVCPFHHSAFDLETGDVKEWAPWPPGFGRMLGAMVRKRVLVTFPVKAEDGFIWVSPEPKNV